MGIWERRPWKSPTALQPSQSEGPCADFLAPPQPLRAVLGQESEVNGKLSFAGPTRIDGRLRGELRGADVLVIGESGYVNGTIRAPTLVVLGETDQILPLSIGRAYHSVIAGSRLVTIERGGHVPQEERPEQTLLEVERWLLSLPG